MAEPHIGSLAHFPPVRQQCVREQRTWLRCNPDPP